jgi:hypothetical protein
MILMPVWVVEETEDGYRAMLGSEPPPTADKEWIPRGFVESCTYGPGDRWPRIAMMVLNGIPEEIRKKNPDFYRNV